MHYVRLLSPPKLTQSPQSIDVSFVFTIATDLEDSLLQLPQPIDLIITCFVTSPTGVSVHPASQRIKSSWQPGSRIAKPTCSFPPQVAAAVAAGQKVEICIGVPPEYTANGVSSILTASEDSKPLHQGQIIPAWTELSLNEEVMEVATRKIHLGKASGANVFVEVEEELGVSIARHIWDAGVVTLCAVAGAIADAPFANLKRECLQKVLQVFKKQGSKNIIELGCGIGVLGIGIAAAAHAYGIQDVNMLITDVDDAKYRAESNIKRLLQRYPDMEGSGSQTIYENLDWEEGRVGRFGAEAASRRWDLIILSDCTYNTDTIPALVETLSSIHKANLSHKQDSTEPTTRVFLTTKPRHDSERVFFNMMTDAGWETTHTQVLPLPVLGADNQSVEMYIFAKTN